MRTYSNYASGKDIMPLMMNFTSPSPISISEPVSFTYSDAEQINYEMRTVGTRCLRSHWTSATRNRSSRSDKANEIDDSKWVK